MPTPKMKIVARAVIVLAGATVGVLGISESHTGLPTVAANVNAGSGKQEVAQANGTNGIAITSPNQVTIIGQAEVKHAQPDPCQGKRKVISVGNVFNGVSPTDITGSDSCGGKTATNVVVLPPGKAMLQNHGGVMDYNEIEDNWVAGGPIYDGNGEFSHNKVKHNTVTLSQK